jgi:hypothetical protein
MAAAAPSANRPWRFDVEDDRIVVRLGGDRTEGSLVGAGAAIGNLMLALAQNGATARWLDRAVDSDADIVAVITLA